MNTVAMSEAYCLRHGPRYERCVLASREVIDVHARVPRDEQAIDARQGIRDTGRHAGNHARREPRQRRNGLPCEETPVFGNGITASATIEPQLAQLAPGFAGADPGLAGI